MMTETPAVTTGASRRAMSGASGSSAGAAPLLKVQDLRTEFATKRGVVHAVAGVSFEIAPGEVLGLVGESGCGKSMTALSLMRLVPRPAGRIAGGSVVLDGEDLLKLSDADMRRRRGSKLSMIFQDPLSSLNPTMKVGKQISEGLRTHRQLSSRGAAAAAIDWLTRVGIPDPARIAGRYPYQLSGGMRQRVMIAMSLCCGPRLVLADEPTTALDVTVQAQIIELLRALTRETATSVVLITHDLGVVAGFCDRIAVMYAGRIVETGRTRDLFMKPAHPYTRGLLASLPSLTRARDAPLVPIPGLPPNLARTFTGCPFGPRCAWSGHACHNGVPALLPVASDAPGQAAACVRAEEVVASGRPGSEPAVMAAPGLAPFTPHGGADGPIVGGSPALPAVSEVSA